MMPDFCNREAMERVQSKAAVPATYCGNFSGNSGLTGGETVGMAGKGTLVRRDSALGGECGR